MSVKSQVGDQTLKGAVIGAASYLLAKWNVDPATQAVVLPAIFAVLAYASTLVGDPKVACFFTKAVTETPVAPAPVVTPAPEKAAAKKAPAKKAAAKKTAE